MVAAHHRASTGSCSTASRCEAALETSCHVLLKGETSRCNKESFESITSPVALQTRRESLI
jgi:hypothetical protein